MRLLNCESKKTKEFDSDENIPKYAILSHRWSDDEVLLRELESNCVSKKGFKKLDLSCRQAVDDGLEWIWIDS